MRFGIVIFPGTWSHQDFFHVLANVLGQEARYLWHKETDLGGCDCVILPGGFAHGDYLRAGAIARFSPIMGEIVRFAAQGGLVLGSCNGFQILCEAGLLPGALLKNDCLHYRCSWVNLRVESSETPFTAAISRGQVVRLPISHGEGRYWADAETLARLKGEGQVIFRYVTAAGEVTAEANPNGSLENIAGICSAGRNVLGLMPHPERAAEGILGGEDGRLMFASLLTTLSTA